MPFKVANTFDFYHLDERNNLSNSPQIHHRNLTDLTTMKFFKIASQPFGSLGFRSILRESQILLFSVVSDVLLFFQHYIHKANQTFSVLCPKRPKSPLPVDC